MWSPIHVALYNIVCRRSEKTKLTDLVDLIRTSAERREEFNQCGQTMRGET